MTTGWIWHEKFGWHDTGTAAGFFKGIPGAQPYHHYESAESKTRFASLVEASDFDQHLTRLQPRQATIAEIAAVHDETHIKRMDELSRTEAGGDMGDGSSPFGPGGFEIAKLAAGAAVVAMDAVVSGQVENAYALVRPPGHHAERASGMGFCMFANIAIGIQATREKFNLERIAVVDWDVHHGNGTESIFKDDPGVLTISLHQDGNYPRDSGGLDQVGVGSAVGTILNVPLPPGSGNGAYEYAFEAVVEPALRRFAPDLIVVACGFDAALADPLAAMMLTSSTYRKLTSKLKHLAQELCRGRLVMVHEGGYSPVYVPFCGLATLEALSGEDSGITDPFEEDWAAWPGQDLQPHQQAVVDRAGQILPTVPLRDTEQE